MRARQRGGEAEKQKAVPKDGLLEMPRSEGGLDLEAPRLKQRLRDELRVLVPARPLTETGGAQILVGSELELFDRLFEGGHNRDDGPDRLRLAPVRIAATLRHD